MANSKGLLGKSGALSLAAREAEEADHSAEDGFLLADDDFVGGGVAEGLAGWLRVRRFCSGDDL